MMHFGCSIQKFIKYIYSHLKSFDGSSLYFLFEEIEFISDLDIVVKNSETDDSFVKI